MAASFGPPARALAAAGALALAAAGPPPATACAPLAVPLAGALALVLRGNCTFAVKARASRPAAREPSGAAGHRSTLLSDRLWHLSSCYELSCTC